MYCLSQKCILRGIAQKNRALFASLRTFEDSVSPRTMMTYLIVIAAMMIYLRTINFVNSFMAPPVLLPSESRHGKTIVGDEGEVSFS